MDRDRSTRTARPHLVASGGVDRRTLVFRGGRHQWPHPRASLDRDGRRTDEAVMSKDARPASVGERPTAERRPSVRREVGRTYKYRRSRNVGQAATFWPAKILDMGCARFRAAPPDTSSTLGTILQHGKAATTAERDVAGQRSATEIEERSRQTGGGPESLNRSRVLSGSRRAPGVRERGTPPSENRVAFASSAVARRTDSRAANVFEAMTLTSVAEKEQRRLSVRMNTSDFTIRARRPELTCGVLGVRVAARSPDYGSTPRIWGSAKAPTVGCQIRVSARAGVMRRRIRPGRSVSTDAA